MFRSRGFYLLILIALGILTENIHAGQTMRRMYRLFLKIKYSPLIHTLREHKDLVFDGIAEVVLAGAQGWLSLKCFSRAKQDKDSFYDAAGVVLAVNALRGSRKSFAHLRDLMQHLNTNKYSIRQIRQKTQKASSSSDRSTDDTTGGSLGGGNDV